MSGSSATFIGVPAVTAPDALLYLVVPKTTRATTGVLKLAQLPFNAVEEVLVVKNIPTERKDTVTGMRVYRFSARYLSCFKMDSHGYYINTAVTGTLRFQTADPSLGEAVVRDWSPLDW